MKFLITGHGRSGTHYMAALFIHFGYRVGFQTEGIDGISHNFLKDTRPFELARDRYDYMIQVVREPRMVVESTYLARYSLPNQNAQRLREINKGNDMERAIRSVVLWNRAIKKGTPDLTVKVEHAPEVCAEWLTKNGLPVQAIGALPPTNLNHRTFKGWYMNDRVPWEDAGDKERSMFVEHCLEYGYPGEFPCDS